MKNRIIALLAALAAALGFHVVTAPPSAAVAGHGWVYHQSDDGYDESFPVVTQWVNGYAYGTVYQIHEGQVRGDVAGIYVRAGTRISCNSGGGWFIAFDATGWHRVGDAFHYPCVNGLDQ